MLHEQATLRCEMVADFSRLQAFAPAWERLNGEKCGSVFQSWGWAKAFWKAHGHEGQLCSPVIFDGDALIGIVPLMLRGGALRLLGEPYADYNGPLCRPQQALPVLNAALSALLDAPFEWQECVFHNLPGDSPLLQCLSLPEWCLRSRFQAVFQYECLAACDDGSNVFAQLARKESLRRHENRLRRRGDLDFRHIEDRREIQKHLDEFFSQQAARRVLSGSQPRFLDAASRTMLRALVDELDPARELRFGVLELNGQAIAYHFGFQQAGKFIWYAPTFDVNYWNDSPGEVLLRYLLRYAQKEKLSEFDFTIGDEAYKHRFANHTQKTWSVYFYRHPWRPQICVRQAGRGLRDVTRRNPRTTEFARRAKRVANSIAEFLREPEALLHTGAAILARVCAWREEAICRRMRPAREAESVQVRRARLRDLAQLKIGNVIGRRTLQELQRRLRQGEALWLVSLPAAEYLFRLRTDSVNGSAPYTKIDLVASGGRVRNPAEALAALLRHPDWGDLVCLELPHSITTNEVLQRVGYALESRCLYISVLGRSICRNSRPATDLLKDAHGEFPPVFEYDKHE